MRRCPGHHASLLRPAEQFFDVPLTAECLHDPASAPRVMIRTQHPPPESGLLQMAAQRRIHVPSQGRLFVVAADLGYYESRQMFAGQRLSYPLLQAAAGDTFGLYKPIKPA